MAGCQDPADRLLNDGNRTAHAGQLDHAREVLTRAVQSRPDDVRSRVLLGNALAAVRDGPAAKAQYAAAIGLDSSCAAARIGLARLALAEDAPDDALRTLQPLPASPEAKLWRARAVLARGQAGDADRALDELKGLSSPEAAYLEGLALVVAHRFSDAQVALDALEPRAAPLAHYGLARLAAAQNRPAEVLRHLAATRRAMGAGWDPLAVASDPAFASLRENPDLVALLSK
jgi:Flp pilus assembly protein TadD